MGRLGLITLACGACCFAVLPSAHGHDGRRFDVGLAGDRLVAQGVNTGNDDGAPAVRPYQNVIHDHWHNSPLGLDSASASLPGFDIRPPVDGALVGYPMYLTLESVVQWDAPPLTPLAGTTPTFSGLQSGELVKVTTGVQSTTSGALGSVLLTPSVKSAGELDIDLLYEINTRPENRIYILSFVLSSGNPLVADSDRVHVLLSPDGANPMEKLHHASLFLEEYAATRTVGVAVPEPSALIVVGLAGLLLQHPTRSARRVRRADKSPSL